MKTSWLAFGTSAIGLALVFVACGGADSANSDVLGAPGPLTNTSTTSSSGASGNSASSTGGPASSSSSTSSSSGSTSSSASSSGACECAAPPPGCTFTGGSNPCDCSVTCPDAGTKPITCTWAKTDPCPDGMYCNAQNCGQGVCVDKAANEGADNNPQCGCDGITYFNLTVAAHHGMAIRNNNACGNDQVTCGGPLASACPAGVTCNHEVKSKNQCLSIEPTGECWQMPATCNTNLLKLGRACNGAQCADICSAIKSGAAWYEDNSCPN